MFPTFTVHVRNIRGRWPEKRIPLQDSDFYVTLRQRDDGILEVRLDNRADESFWMELELAQDPKAPITEPTELEPRRTAVPSVFRPFFFFAAGFLLACAASHLSHDPPPPPDVVLTVTIDDHGKMQANPQWDAILRHGVKRAFHN